METICRMVGATENLIIREFATMRDGQTIIRVQDRSGDTFWLGADLVEVITL